MGTRPSNCPPWAVFGAAISGLACARVSDDQRFPPQEAQLTVLHSVPAPDETDVGVDAHVDVCLSGRVDPRSVTDADATVSSGRRMLETDLEVQLVPFKAPGGAPVDPDATDPWCAGGVLSITPKMDLAIGVRYRARVLEAIDGWNGERFDTDQPGWIEEEGVGFVYVVEFTVGEEAGGIPRSDPPTLSDLFDAGGPFDPQRANCSCHLEPGATAFELLDLRTPESAFEALVLPGRARDTGFPMVSPRLPSESFLIHKLLREDDGGPLRGVLGDPMPRDGVLPYADYVAIARWIEGGAEP